jgi:hypothetical protein
VVKLGWEKKGRDGRRGVGGIGKCDWNGRLDSDNMVGRASKQGKPAPEELGCQCGAGMPCQCNIADPPDTSQIIEEPPATLH